MRKLFKRVSHTTSLQWINWLLNPESSGVHFWYIQKAFRQRAVWENLSLFVCVCGHVGWENSISAYYKTEKKQIIANLIWPLPTLQAWQRSRKTPPVVLAAHHEQIFKWGENILHLRRRKVVFIALMSPATENYKKHLKCEIMKCKILNCILFLILPLFLPTAFNFLRVKCQPVSVSQNIL